MKAGYLQLLFWFVLIAALTGCSLTGNTPQVTGEVAQAVTDSTKTVQASDIGEVLYQDVNIPMKYMLLLSLGFWCLRPPWTLLGEIFTPIGKGIKWLVKLF